MQSFDVIFCSERDAMQKGVHRKPDKKNDEQVRKIIIKIARCNVELPDGKGGGWPTP